MKIGYARVSTRDQNLDLQIDALRQAGCTDTYIYKEHFTGSSKERPQLKKLLRDDGRARGRSPYQTPEERWATFQSPSNRVQ